MRDIPTLVVCVAPLPQQSAIAAFLDRETRRIDGLVAKKERLSELLQEKRAALITRAVTKGLDPSVPMKDSDVEWLPEIPIHWDVKPNGSLFQERDERRRDDLPILEVSIASGVRVREFSETKVEQRSDDLGAYKVARAGDITFNKMRMWQGAVGRHRKTAW
jgi:type I restriction enzyme S subunit